MGSLPRSEATLRQSGIRRIRDAHDLFHTLTGYDIDVNGEGGVLSFTFGQTGNKGWLALVFLNHLLALRVARFDGWLVSFKGYLRGRRARHILSIRDWGRLLELPLEEVRVELGIAPLEPYTRLTHDNVFGLSERAT